jgi:hypothetical protein
VCALTSHTVGWGLSARSSRTVFRNTLFTDEVRLGTFTKDREPRSDTKVCIQHHSPSTYPMSVAVSSSRTTSKRSLTTASISHPSVFFISCNVVPDSKLQSPVQYILGNALNQLSTTYYVALHLSHLARDAYLPIPSIGLCSKSAWIVVGCMTNCIAC